MIFFKTIFTSSLTLPRWSNASRHRIILLLLCLILLLGCGRVLLAFVVFVIRRQLEPARWTRVVLLQPRQQTCLVKCVLTGHLDYGLILGLELFFVIVSYAFQTYAALNLRSFVILHLFLFQRGDGRFRRWWRTISIGVIFNYVLDYVL